MGSSRTRPGGIREEGSLFQERSVERDKRLPVVSGIARQVLLQLAALAGLAGQGLGQAAGPNNPWQSGGGRKLRAVRAVDKHQPVLGHSGQRCARQLPSTQPGRLLGGGLKRDPDERGDVGVLPLLLTVRGKAQIAEALDSLAADLVNPGGRVCAQPLVQLRETGEVGLLVFLDRFSANRWEHVSP